MRKLLLATTIASLVLAAPAAHAQEWGGLVGGLAGGLIAGAIIASQQPHYYYVPAQRHRHVAPRPRVVVRDRTVVRTVYTQAPAAAPAPAPAAVPVNNNNVVLAPAPAPAPIIINTASAPAAPSSATADRCQRDFQKTSDYLACLNGVAAK